MKTLTVFRRLYNYLEIQLEILVNQQPGKCGKHCPKGYVVDISADRGVDLLVKWQKGRKQKKQT